MKKNKRVVYKVNENSQRKRFKRLPMFENYLEEKYDSVKLLDGHKYTLTNDVVAEGGQVLAKKGDTVTYEDVVGVFANNATEFTTDCGVFRTEDGQALCPEILMSQDLVSDPQAKMTEDPKAFMAEVVAECRKIGQKLGKAVSARKKIYESLTDEQKKKYQQKKEKLTSEQIEKYNQEIDSMEEKAQKLYDDMEAGKITQEEMMQKTDHLTKSALEKYRIVSGGEDPAWYEDYMDEPGFGKVNEAGGVSPYFHGGYNIADNDYYNYLLDPDGPVDYYYTVNVSSYVDDDNDMVPSFCPGGNDKDVVNKILKFCADNGVTITKNQLPRTARDGRYFDIEILVDDERDELVDFRVYDPENRIPSLEKYSNNWSEWQKYDPANAIYETEEATETEIEDTVTDDVLTPETVETVLTTSDDVKEETVEAVIDAVKDDAKEGEEISLEDVVDATVDAELSKEEATAVIDAVVDAVVDQKVEEKTVNESKERSLKKAVKESLCKKFRKGIFEARVMKIRNKKK